MSTLFRFLTLLLCLELIVSPIAPNISLIAQNAYAEDCPTGFTYDSILNRCLTKTETANVMNATMACGDDTQCYKENAQKAFQDKVNAGEAPEKKGGGGFVSTVGQAAAIAVPLALLMGGTKDIISTCAAPALYAMIAGSVALIAGENLANMQHRSRLKKIKESWGKIVNPEDAGGDKDKERETSIEAQSQAFEKLAEAEDSMVKAAKMKKTFFTIAALAFTASAGLAIYEHTQFTIALSNPTTAAAAKVWICEPKTASYKSKKPSLFEEYSSGQSEEAYAFQHQFDYNLQNSNDFVSFIMNQKAAKLKDRSPSVDEFYSMKQNFAESELMVDRSAFDVFKEVSITMMKQLNPISSAQAVEQVADSATSEESGSGSSGSGLTSSSSGNNSATSTSVNTNAAKAFKEDEGKGINFLSIGLGAAAGIAAGKMMKQTVILPLGRAAIAGLLAGWTMIMRNHAASQAEASQKRADLLRKMKDEFASASGAIYSCKSEDRNDPGKPNCYCYTSENQRNSNRGNSQICQKLWAGLNKGTSLLATANQSSRVCVNQNRQADATCACKQSNTCMKVSLSSVKGLGLGSMGVIGNALAPVNGVTTGSIDGATIGEADLASRAAKMNELVKKMENTKGMEDFKKKKDKQAALLAKNLSSAAGSGGNGFFGGSANSGMPSNAGEAARMLEKEIAEQAPATGVSGSQTISTGNEAAPEQPLEFGLTGDQLAAQEGQIAEAMKQDLDYGGNDINQGSKTNIFEVLSNRYQRSGMRRLFDEKGETKPEAASKTDITQ